MSTVEPRGPIKYNDKNALAATPLPTKVGIMGKTIIGAIAAVATIASTMLATACGSSGPSHSASYNAGYDAGSHGAARQSGAGSAGNPVSVEQACNLAKDGAALAPKGAPTYISDFNGDEYVQGCLAAFKDHPVGS
jgi:hypothetical protein